MTREDLLLPELCIIFAAEKQTSALAAFPVQELDMVLADGTFPRVVTFLVADHALDSVEGKLQRELFLLRDSIYLF